MARAFLPSCLMEEGNMRLIHRRAGSASNLDGRGLIRLILTNLEQMRVSQVSEWMLVQTCKMPTAEQTCLSVPQPYV